MIKRFCRPLTAGFIASAALMAATTVQATAQKPGLWPVGIPADTSWMNGQGQLGQWYVSSGYTHAWATASGADEQYAEDAPLMGLAKPVVVVVDGDDAAASASASVTNGKLRVAAQASNRTLDSVGAAAVGIADVRYFTLMEQPGAITIDVRLTGSLAQDGQRFPEPSVAGVLATAMGSGPMPDWQGVEEWAVDGLIPIVPNINHPHLQFYNEVLIAGDFDKGLERAVIDRSFSVTAIGVPFACGGLNNQLCGKYGYYFTLSLSAGVLNGGTADFGHTLEITAIHVPQGTTLSFDPGQAVPVITSAVPESSTVLLCAAGLLTMALVRRRTRA